MTVVMLDTLTAAAVDLDRRLIEGTIVPFGVPGLTSAGRLTIEAGALVWAPDLSRLKLTREHDRTAPVAYATVLEPRAGGLFARFKVAPTPEGDTALLEAAEHVRDGLSVDLVDVILSDDGTRVVSGRIATVGLCSVPAYDEARVTRVAATQPNEGSVMDTLTTEPVDPTPPGPADPPHAVSAAAPALPDPEPVAVLATVPAGSTRTEPRSPLTLQAAAGTIARAARGDLAPSAMMAALSDFTTAPASGGGAIPPQWVGQLWEEADATRIHVDAVNGPRPVTSLKVQGFKWVDTLKVAAWTGDKAAIPSNAPTLVPEEETVGRWAGGVDVAREFVDLGHGDVIVDLLKQATNDYRTKTDLACLADLIAGSTAGAADSAKNALTVIRTTLAAIRQVASTIFLAADMWEELADTPGPAPAYPQLGSLPTVTLDPDLPAGHALGLVKAGATFYEKGPINVDALNIAQGGIDEAVFGYTATMINRVAAIIYVTVTAPIAQSASTSSSK